MSVRRATLAHAEAIARLGVQLGYPDSPEAYRRRMQLVLPDHLHGVFIAEDEAGQVVGWVHVTTRANLVSDPFAEVIGLVVDEAARGQGHGKALMDRAEQWAKDRQLPGIRLRSNLKRKEAHEFYQSVGMERIKDQRVYHRTVDLS
jgi:GNAT superfamily N-acetyltransferase